MTETQQEAREERTAIMAAESVPQAQIDAVFRRYVEIYGIADYQETQGELIK